jgi:ribosome-binding ATPase YchF (GTP1/OBG family)
VQKRAEEEGEAAVVFSAKIETEIAVLPSEEREMFLSEIGLKEPGLDRMIRVGYGQLHLLTFFTRGRRRRALDRDQGLARAAGGGRDPRRFRARLHPSQDDRV